MSTTTATTTGTSPGGFHATPTAQRADELTRASFDAVNADHPARTDAVPARSFLSHDVHCTRSRTGLRRYHSDLRRSALFYATDDDSATTTIERLIRAVGFDPFKAGGIEAAGRIEAPDGDLHQFGLNGQLVDLAQARIALGAAEPPR